MLQNARFFTLNRPLPMFCVWAISPIAFCWREYPHFWLQMSDTTSGVYNRPRCWVSHLKRTPVGDTLARSYVNYRIIGNSVTVLLLFQPSLKGVLLFSGVLLNFQPPNHQIIAPTCFSFFTTGYQKKCTRIFNST